MRVLLVNAFASSSKSGMERYVMFRQNVLTTMHELERQSVTQVDIIEKTRHNLDDFLFEMHSTFANPQMITHFDQLDFVVVVGDPSTSPWAPAMQKLVLLTKMCMMTGKCFYGSGLGAGILSFLCSTAGESIRVINNDGKGSIVDNMNAIPPPSLSPTVLFSSKNKNSLVATDVFLDTRTGDFFKFDQHNHTWIPHGNTGLVISTSDRAKNYGCRMNKARGGTKSHISDLGNALVVSKKGDTKCCIRLEFTNHPLVNNLGINREFLVNCTSTWDLDPEINATGDNQYNVLIDSNRGPMLIEFGNCIGTHFTMAKDYPETCKVFKKFIHDKYQQFQVHEHIDRSYVSAISGSQRLKQRLQVAQSKTIGTNSVRLTGSTIHQSSISPNQHDSAILQPTLVMKSGKTSPKRCRPLSAGPFRVSAHIPAPTIQTSRSVYHTLTAEASTKCDILHTTLTDGIGRIKMTSTPSLSFSDVKKIQQHNNQHRATEQYPEVDSPPSSPGRRSLPAGTRPMTGKHPPSSQSRRLIRVIQKNGVEKPYCAIEKFDKMRELERLQNKNLYYSVVNDAPYMSPMERQALEHQQSKLKWTGGPFQTVIGKASTQLLPEPSVFTRAPFNQKNTPYHIIQRRQLEPSPPRARPNNKS